MAIRGEGLMHGSETNGHLPHFPVEIGQRVILQTDFLIKLVQEQSGNSDFTIQNVGSLNGDRKPLVVEGKYTGIWPFHARDPIIGPPDLLSLDRAQYCHWFERRDKNGSTMTTIIPSDAELKVIEIEGYPQAF